MQENQTHESKYIQQHLANERTYLAWLRTSLAIIGIGVLVASLHYNTKTGYRLNDIIVVVLSFYTFFVGLSTIIFSTYNYYRIRKGINSQTFKSSNNIIIYITILMIFTLLFLLSYILFI